MYKKIKFKGFILVVLAAFLSIFFATIMLGRVSTKIWIVEKEGFDLNKTIGEQQEYFSLVSVSKEDVKKFAGSIVLEKELPQHFTSKLMVPLSKGAPIPKSALRKDSGGGSFTSSMPKHQTIYRLAGPGALPPGAYPGDLIDIIVNIKEGKVETSSILYRDVPIYSIDQTGVYIKVSQSRHQELEIAKKLGTFVLQLPGQKEVKECAADEAQNRNKEKIECYVPEDDAGKVTSEDVLEKILQNKIYSIESSLEEEQE